MSRKNMITLAKQMHAQGIAEKITVGGTRSSDQLRKDYEKDLMKLNYTTLVALSPRVKK